MATTCSDRGSHRGSLAQIILDKPSQRTCATLKMLGPGCESARVQMFELMRRGKRISFGIMLLYLNLINCLNICITDKNHPILQYVVKHAAHAGRYSLVRYLCNRHGIEHDGGDCDGGGGEGDGGGGNASGNMSGGRVWVSFGSATSVISLAAIERCFDEGGEADEYEVGHCIEHTSGVLFGIKYGSSS